MRRGRKYRRLEIERVLGKLAWTGQELAQVVKISPLNARRYLRRYYYSGRLVRKKFGSIWYYAVAIFLKPPTFIYPCPRCSGKMSVYKKKCGCTFQLCERHSEHSLWKYCETHKGTVVGYVDATCSICGAQERIKVRNGKFQTNWQNFGMLTVPGKDEKVEYWECEKCIKERQLIPVER